MRFSPVCPIDIYEGLEQHSPAAIGDYFLLLAHDVLANAKRYEAFFKDRACTIIMDNSVIELGDACTAQNLLEAAQIVDATCVAMPDVLRDGEASFKRTSDFIDEWLTLPGHEKHDTMFIPQGKDAKDFVECVDAGIKYLFQYIKWVGVPRNLVPEVMPTRRMAVGMIRAALQHRCRELGQHLHPRVHLLGFSDDVVDDVKTCLHFKEYLAGIDSAVPLRVTVDLLEVASRPSEMPDPGPRGNWWEEVKYDNLIAGNVIAARQWIHEL